MKHIMLGADEMRDLLTKSITEVGRVRIELSQGAVNEVIAMCARLIEPVE